MLSHWVQPVQDEIKIAASTTPLGYLGRQMIFADGDQRIPKGSVILLGVTPLEADAIRMALYRFASPDTHLHITDLGNFRKPNQDFCIPLVQELLSAGHVVILMGKDEEVALLQFLAYADFRRVSNMALIDNQLKVAIKQDPNLEPSPLQQILHPQHKRLFHFSLIGGQAHLLPIQTQRFLEKKSFDNLRLGRLRSEIAEAEPLIRDMDLVTAHLRVLRTPALTQGTLSGLTLEELCQLARFAGMSEKVTSLSVVGVETNSAFHSEAGAQLIWYFIEGLSQRHGDFPVSVNQMTEYIVDLQKLSYRLTFWKSNKSGRWWVQVPVLLEKNKERHKLVPCTFYDYQLASKEELSDRLVKAFERFM